MVEGSVKGIKYAMLVANAAIFIGGLAVFSVGLWTLSEKTFMERLLGTRLYVASAAILIATGLVVALISIVGSVGAWREVRCMLITFFFIMAIIFLTMLTGGILGYIFRSQVDERMHSEMIMTINLYGNETTVTKNWDNVQRKFNCCGLIPNLGKPRKDQRAYRIWASNSRHFKSSGPMVPESCCRNPADPQSRKACLREGPSEKHIFLEDCYEKMKDYVKSHALLIGGIGIGIAALLVFGMILSCILFAMIK